jgi:Mg2+/Co2+ transporter CorB
MSEQRFEDDGVEYNNNYNYSLLDTHYEFDGKRIIEWNKHSSNAEYTDFERITEILNIKQMRLESLMKHREEIGKLLDRIDEQQDRIKQLEAQLNECRKPNPVERITTYI